MNKAQREMVKNFVAEVYTDISCRDFLGAMFRTAGGYQMRKGDGYREIVSSYLSLAGFSNIDRSQISASRYVARITPKGN